MIFVFRAVLGLEHRVQAKNLSEARKQLPCGEWECVAVERAFGKEPDREESR